MNQISKEELSNELVRLANELGKTPSSEEMNEIGNYSSTTYVNTFGNWNNSLVEVGLNPLKRNFITEEEVLESAYQVGEEFGYPPTITELDKYGVISSHMKRYDSFSELIGDAFYDDYVGRAYEILRELPSFNGVDDNEVMEIAESVAGDYIEYVTEFRTKYRKVLFLSVISYNSHKEGYPVIHDYLINAANETAPSKYDTIRPEEFDGGVQEILKYRKEITSMDDYSFLPVTDTAKYVEPIFYQFDIPNRMTEEAKEIIEKVQSKTIGQSPVSIVGAVLYILGQRDDDFTINQSEIADELDVSTVTIRNRYKDIESKLSE